VNLEADEETLDILQIGGRKGRESLLEKSGEKKGGVKAEGNRGGLLAPSTRSL